MKMENQTTEDNPATAETITRQIPQLGSITERFVLVVKGMSFRQTFAALKHRNYRIWFIGQMASLIGTWMQMTAQGFLVFELTNSPAYLGYVGFASGIPSWIFMLYGGVISDRMPRRKLLMITQSVMMVLAFVLASLTFVDLIRPWHIVVMAFLLGIANAFDAPSRHAFVFEMVNREDLSNAIALNSTMFNSATVIGPAVGGVIYATMGPEWCFGINGLSFIAVLSALCMMRLTPQPPRNRETSALQDLKEGLIYALSHPIIRVLIIVEGIVSLFGMSYATLMPAWAVTILGGDATTNGWLQSARGVGALSGALMIASLGRFRFKGRMVMIGTTLLPVLLLIFSAIRDTIPAMIVLMGIGCSFMMVFNLLNALIQIHVSDELRGRVMSLYSLVFFGASPLGALFVGALAEWTSEPVTVMIAALITLTFAMFLHMRVPTLRTLE